MTSMVKVRNRFIVLLAIFLAVDVGLVAYLLWPRASNNLSEAQMRVQLIVKQKQVEPLKGIDKTLEDTRSDIKSFYAERVLGHWSQVSTELHRLAQQSGVTMQAIQYKPEETGLPNLQRVGIETGIAGDYVKIAHFINALERDKFLFVINLVTLRAQQGGMVELQISFDTFLKEAA